MSKLRYFAVVAAVGASACAPDALNNRAGNQDSISCTSRYLPPG